MSKKTEIKSVIGQYKTAYLAAVKELEALAKSGNYTEKGLEEKRGQLAAKYDSTFAGYKAQLQELITATQEGIQAKNAARTAKNLENADKALFVLKAIESGGMTADSFRAVLPSFADDPLSLNAFRGALLQSNDEQLRLLSAEVPEDHSMDGYASLEKFKGTVDRIPGAGTIGNGDMAQGLFDSGVSFDGMADFVDTLSE